MATTDKPASILIALRFFETGGRPFEPCDRFDRSDFPQISDRRIMQMTEARYIGPLTSDAYARAARMHAPGHVGKGFSREGLIGMGILSADAPAAAKKAPKAPPKKAAAPLETAVDAPQSIIDDGYDVVELHNGYWLAGRKRGVATRFDIFDAAGARLNPGKTENGIKNARAEADRMLSVAQAEAQNHEAEGADEPVIVRLDEMSDDELREMLEKHGLSVGENDDRAVMLSMARVLDISTGADASDTSDAYEQMEAGDGSDIRSSDDGTEGSRSSEDR